MRRYLLRGDLEKQKEYIERAQKENGIPGHLKISYEPPFSIKDAHALKSLLSLALSKEEKRIVIVPSSMSLEAQSALLKLLEELGEDTFFYIQEVGSSELLPTILSRVTEVRLGETFNADPQLDERLSILGESEIKIESIAQLSVFLSEYKNEAPTYVANYLREQLRNSPTNTKIVTLLERLYENLEMYYTNNIHKRFFWDMVLLSGVK